MFGIARMIARSWKHICVPPFGPVVMPVAVPTIFTFASAYATEIVTASYTRRVANGAKLAQKGISPSTASPALMPIISASATPTSMNRSGCASEKVGMVPVALARSASSTTMSGFSSANSTSVRA